MKKHLTYMRKNEANDARIIMPFEYGWCIIHPSLIKIKRETAKAIICKLKLSCIPAYKDYRNHERGSSMYVFESNVHKYQPTKTQAQCITGATII